VGLSPGETVEIQLPFFIALASRPLIVQALDGGSLSKGEVVSGADGTTSFGFQVAVQPGLYRVLLSIGDKTATLQFWVPNPQNPAGNLPVVNSGN
jgi:hypothetical protein